MRPYLLGVAVVAVIALAIAGAWYLSASAEAGEPVSVGVLRAETTALFYIADERGYFAENGLNVTMREYPNLLAAIEDMKNGTLDIAQSSEYPIITEALAGEPVSVVGCVDIFQSAYLASRTDRGIRNASDLAGKRIGVLRGSTTEFYLGRFLNLNGVAVQEVTVVDMPWDRTVEELANGSVDAIVIRRQAEVAPVKERFSDGVVVWPLQNDQPSYLVASCRNDWIAAHPGTVEGVLRALARAEDFAIENPGEAKAIVGQRTGLSRAYLDDIWPLHRFGLTLDRSLLTAMNDEARWAIENNLTNATAVPDFTQYIDPAPLASVDPGAVKILGIGGRTP